MSTLWATLFESDFMPHGHCYRWEPAVLWLNVASDALIALAYYSIPTSLATFGRRRPDIGFQWMTALFVAFIFACGTTHAMAIWTVWHPDYGLEGLVKAATALLSSATAVLLVRLLPQALALPSPTALEAANAALAAEVDRRKIAEERYRTLLESAPDGMVISDATGCITFANAQTEALFGMPRAELIGQNIEILIPERLRRSHVGHRTAYLDEPRLRPMGAGLALHGRRRDGSEFPVEISLSPLQTDSGILVTAAIRDITERRRAEDIVREYGERLEALSRQLLSTQEIERRTIACELHDEIGQSLTALKLGLGTCRERMATPMLDESVTLVERVLQQVRELSLGLRPSLLDDLGLAAALRWFVDRQARRAGWTGHVDAEGLDRRFSPEVEIGCFRVVQEAVTNVVRHANARHVTVSARQVESGIAIAVRDDGRGMDVGSARRGALLGASMGIFGMEERVSLLGGHFEIVSEVGEGTEVRAFIPERPPIPTARAS
jgi:PAS domain S-box-containing protein